MADKKLILMSCCALCSAAAIRMLKEEVGGFIVLFYNPNIFPRGEYDRRLAEQIRLCEKYGVEYAVGNYDHDSWLNCVKGLEGEPERGRRCMECFKMRLAWGAKWARENGGGALTSVFGASPHKDKKQVNAAAKTYFVSRVSYHDFNFDYAPEPGMYRQKYCGCEFSLQDRAGARIRRES